MKLKVIQINTIFDYIKDIRRYSYDIEESLKSNIGNNLRILPTPPVPDEIEAELSRFSCEIDIEEVLIRIELSQVRLTVISNYKNPKNKIIEDEIDSFINIVDKVKELIIEKIVNFNILYEGVVVITENISSNISDIEILKITADLDEKRKRETKTFENTYFVITEKIFLRAYQQTNNIGLLNKNTTENFAGYIETLVKEVNNRLAYNIQVDTKNNKIEIERIKPFLIEGVIK